MEPRTLLIAILLAAAPAAVVAAPAAADPAAGAGGVCPFNPSFVHVYAGSDADAIDPWSGSTVPHAVDGRYHDSTPPLVDCDGDGLPDDTDGDRESGLAGAVLGVVDWAAQDCWDVTGHHPEGGVVHVADALYPATVFLVAAEGPTGTWPDCGDGVLTTTFGLMGPDQMIVCVSACEVPFPAGVDGAYHVIVLSAYDPASNAFYPASGGTIWIEAAAPPPPPCAWSYREVGAYTETAWGTDATLYLDFKYGCPGGPVVTWTQVQCNDFQAGWTNTACTYASGVNTRGVVATHQCGSSSCAGAPSPHTVEVWIDFDNAGGFSCDHSGPGSPYTACWQW